MWRLPFGKAIALIEFGNSSWVFAQGQRNLLE